MKLFHAADLHLDSPMKGLVAYDEAPVERLRLATRVALANLVDAAIDEQVDVVILAGDIFDGDWPHYGTGVHFVSEMGRLCEAGIAVVSIAGNHDAASKLTKTLRLPDNVTVLDVRKPQTVRFDELGLAVHGQGYATPAVMEDLSKAYPSALADMVNVGLLHTCAEGRPGHERYAPCSVPRLAAHGYDYWALGHIHQRAVLHDDPPVVFAGNLQGRGLHESGPKGATLIEVSPDGEANFDHRVLDCVRWERIEVDAGDSDDLDDVCEKVSLAVRQAVAPLGDRLLAARVVIAGSTEAHGALIGNQERTRYEVVAAAAAVAGDQVWIESARVTTAPRRALAGTGDDAVGELVSELDELDANESTVTEIAKELGSVADVLPLSVLERFNPRDPDTVAQLMADVRRSLPVALLERTGS